MTAISRILRPRTLAFALFALLVCALVTVWAVEDASPPRDATVQDVPNGETNSGLAPDLASLLSGLAHDMAASTVSGGNVAAALRATSPADKESATATELAELAARHLRWMESAAGDHQDGSAAATDRGDPDWRRLVDAVRLEVWSIERMLTEEEPDRALKTATAVLEFCARVSSGVASLSGFMMARSCQHLVVVALVRGIDEKRWGDTQLETMATIEPRVEWAAPLARALRSDYSTVAELARQQQVGSWWLTRAFVYHPNRTLRDWSDLMSPVFAALQNRDIVGAYDAMAQQLGGLSVSPIGRNAAGRAALASTAAAYPTLIAQTQSASMNLRMLSIRASLELSLRDHQGWPRTHDELERILGGGQYSDPWQPAGAHLTYATDPARLYSVGSNRVNDGGRFDASLSFSNLTDDYGIKLPD